jgi:hypothetical protein
VQQHDLGDAAHAIGMGFQHPAVGGSGLMRWQVKRKKSGARKVRGKGQPEGGGRLEPSGIFIGRSNCSISPPLILSATKRA